MLRDPIERYRSAQTHGLRKDWSRDSHTERAAFDRGLYTRQVERLYDTFPADQVLVLQYERCVQDAAAQLARTYAFLGLKPHTLAQEELDRERNSSRGEKVTIDPKREELLRHYYEPDIRALTSIVRDLDVSLWPNFAEMATPVG